MTGYSEDVKTPLARIAYANGLFKARATAPGAAEKFGCTLLFAKTDNIDVLKAAAVAAAKNEWEGRAEEMIKNGIIKTPFLDGDGPQGMNKDTGARHVGHAGHVFIRVGANKDRQPKVYNAMVMPAVENASDVKEGPYSGCFVFAVVNAYTWTNDQGGKGISFGVSMVQSAKNGDPMGRAAPSADKFLEKIDDQGAAPDAAKSSAGAAGLFS